MILMRKYETDAATVLKGMPAGKERRNAALLFVGLALMALRDIKCKVDYFRHGDFHLGNVVFDSLEDRRVRLLDFGRSRIVYTTILRNKKTGVRQYEQEFSVEARLGGDADVNRIMRMTTNVAPEVSEIFHNYWNLKDDTPAQVEGIAKSIMSLIEKPSA